MSFASGSRRWAWRTLRVRGSTTLGHALQWLEVMQECSHLSPPFLCGLINVGSFRGPHHLDVCTLSRASDQGSASLWPALDFL